MPVPRVMAKPRLAPAARTECSALRSETLGHSVAYCVLLPPSYELEKARRYPTLYLLHGLGDNEQMLLRSGGMSLVEDLWQQHRAGEFLVVTPAGGVTFYINSQDGRTRYEDFFLHEFIPFIERRYRSQPGRAFRGIAGISMGGYGALHIAFRHPELFASVSAHSAAIIERPPIMQTGASRSLGRSAAVWRRFRFPDRSRVLGSQQPSGIGADGRSHRAKDLLRLRIRRRLRFQCGRAGPARRPRRSAHPP